MHESAKSEVYLVLLTHSMTVESFKKKKRCRYYFLGSYMSLLGDKGALG